MGVKRIGLETWCLAIVMTLIFAGSVTLADKIWADSCDSSNSKPAVSKINAKVSGGYADFDAAPTGFGTASLTLPLTHRFGLSIDALGGNYSADSLWGVGGSLFWRNPDNGLLGIVGSNVQVGAVNGYRGGLTGELYLGKFTVLADAGYENGKAMDDAAFADMQLHWYALDNLMLGAGCAYSNNSTAGLINAEYIPGLKILPGLALFVEGSWGDDNYHSVMTGVRYYFGGTGKTLIQKHREDDPPNNALNGLALCSQGNCFNDNVEDDADDGMKGDDDIVDDIITDDTMADTGPN